MVSGTQHVFDLLAGEKLAELPVLVIFGDDPFLRRQALAKVLGDLTFGDDADLSVMRFDGESARWVDLHDELSTVSLFGDGDRIVVLESADDFVSKHRTQLEDYVANPSRAGVLVIVADTWVKTTRLYSAIDKIGLQIDCRAPQTARGKSTAVDHGRIVKWLIEWGKQAHSAAVSKDAAQRLYDLVGSNFDMLDQSLAKLALYVSGKQSITVELVDDKIGGWQAKTAWEMVDAAAMGDAVQAVQQLDRLIQSGDAPVALLGQISWSLRRYATAADQFLRSQREKTGGRVQDALSYAGFRNWNDELRKAEERLKQMGRGRVRRLNRWLLETDLALKGSHSSPDRARQALELLVFKLARLTSTPVGTS
jgi:DNA polymerase III subunit delta